MAWRGGPLHRFGSSDVDLLTFVNGGKGREIKPFSTILVPVSDLPKFDQPRLVSASRWDTKRNRDSGVVVGLSVALGVMCLSVFVLVGGILWYWNRKRKLRKGIMKEAAQKKGILIQTSNPDESFMADVSECLDKYKVFPVEELREATMDFDDGCVIEGSVYRGHIRGEVYAVKKMKWNAFEELKILQKVNHHSLVRLEGFCINAHDGNCYLVYEYVQNGSLHSWLHGGRNRSRGEELDWKRRLQIAVDVANGLQYIHQHTSPSVVHKDIKSSNILLDGSLRAKIANFGLARTGCNAVTTNILGTQGYLAPEYLQDGLVTDKMDVFAFGVVLLELVSGREAIGETGEMLWAEAERTLFQEGRKEEEYSCKEERFKGWVDEALVEQCGFSTESVGNVVSVARACLQRHFGRRPSMVDIVYMLCKADELYFDFSEDGLVPTGIMARVLYSFWWKPKRIAKFFKDQGVVGLPYKFLYGNFKEHAALEKESLSKPMPLSHNIIPRVAPLFQRIVQKYGKTSVVWLGTLPRVIIMDPEAIKAVLSNKNGQFEKSKTNALTKLLATGLAHLEGDKWATHRKILNPAFHLDKIKDMVPAFYASCKDLICKWDAIVDKHGGSYEVDVWPDFLNLTGDVISRTAFGSNYLEGRPIFELQSEQAYLLRKALSAPYFPGLEYLPTKDNRRRKELDKSIKALLKGIIEKKENAMKLDPEGSQNDLLGLLLESNLKESRESGGAKVMTPEELIEECKLFYFAGQETTNILLTWTMIVLSMHPEWQNRAREEVLKIFGKNKPDYEALTQLKTVTMILHEVLRLYPPVTFLNRGISKKTRLGGITFPAGVEVSLPTLFLHHDKELWGEDAGEFNPERFSGGISKAVKHPAAFLPFGGGPRICIGMNFGLTEAKLALSMILHKFWFELSPSYAHAPHTVIILRPQHGAQIILHKL
ncbi:hypothetical protein H6P81_008164 [Aristolochia fimbriata]|uniref:Protein kinase domain-containing protein n=1 Tax=Aristolochia fimbriata TaxID=158543 RepID=A0AAV7F4L1_ARIFI|nr:hypothetical protein H6P81_008164 [Aristolochia fimbriata]